MDKKLKKEIKKKKRKERRKRRLRRLRNFLMFIVIIVIIFFASNRYTVLSVIGVKNSVVVNVGEEIPSIDYFLKNPYEGASFITNMDSIDKNIPGVYEVKLKVGLATVKSKLVIKDDIAPEILGLKDKTVCIGETISYRENVTVIDNVSEGIELKIDSSLVNLSAVGTYKVKYTAIDKAKNKTIKNINVTVVENEKMKVVLEELNALTDDILSAIIKENMTELQKAEVIYDWVKGNISYISYSDKDSWIQGAYEGLINKKGDCFVYFATSKQLLTRAGINNVDVKAYDGRHYWNMINCGTGWYHFDTTRFAEDVKIFMWTDKQLDGLYLGGRQLHVWDKEKQAKLIQNID